MKQALIILAILCTHRIAQAQATIGILVGFNGTDLRSEQFENTSSRKGYAFGGIIDFGLYENFEFRVMPLFSQKGNDVAGPIPIEFKLDYFEVPALLKYTLTETRVAPYVMGGLSFGLLLRANVKTPVSFGVGTGEELFKDIDVGSSFGAGIRFRFSKYLFFLEGRYTSGIANINEDFNRLGFTTDIKSRAFQIGIGILFPPKRD
ncbi:MAG: porin family protein [bacterium]